VRHAAAWRTIAAMTGSPAPLRQADPFRAGNDCTSIRLRARRVDILMADRVLLYGTGGAAWSRVEQSFTTSNRVNTFVPVNRVGSGDTDSAWGYQAGGGLEIRIGGRWGVVGEYLFTSLDDRDESTIRAPTRPLAARELGLFEHVVPERRWSDVHLPRNRLARRQGPRQMAE
jgi:hypothetical protein